MKRWHERRSYSRNGILSDPHKVYQRMIGTYFFLSIKTHIKQQYRIIFRSLDVIYDSNAMQHPFNAIIPHHSVDSALDTSASPNLISGFRIPGSIYSASSSSGVGSGYSSVSGGSRHLEHLADYQKRDFLHTAENQLQSLMTTTPASNILVHSQPIPAHSQPPVIQHQTQHHPSYPFNNVRDLQSNANWMSHHDYQNMSFNTDSSRIQRNDETTSTTITDSRSSRYDLQRASRLYQTHDDVEPVKRFVCFD